MLLRDYLTDNEMTQTEFARRIGCSHVTVGYWSRGLKQPTPKHAALIRAATSGEVTPDDLQAALELSRTTAAE